jgi:subtilisin family serine protease
MEITRQYVILREQFRHTAAGVVKDDPEYKRYLRIKEDFHSAYNEAKQNYDYYYQLMDGLDRLEKTYGPRVSSVDLDEYTPRNTSEVLGIILLRINLLNKDSAEIDGVREIFSESFEHFEYLVNYGYNTRFDPREELVGDNYDDPYEKGYGNNRIYINSKFSSHGTHVAGIIAASGDNELGGMGICQTARIMALRCVPEGDERDKDVANAIRYAVDNGAKVINMSFGKGYEHMAGLVWEAIAYARENGVLLVHGAGNDANNNDHTDVFPNDKGGELGSTWLEVGASSWYKRPHMLADFSNYGRRNVDLFAPGVDIYSTYPDSSYVAISGTSMASPVVAGIAAMIWSYYPELTAADVRMAILDGVYVIKRRQTIPGAKRKKRKLKKLCASGGIINITEALTRAAEIAQTKS